MKFFVPFVFVLFVLVTGCGGGGGVALAPDPKINQGAVKMSVGVEAHPTDRTNVADRRAQIWDPAFNADFSAMAIVAGNTYDFTVFPRFQQIESADAPTEVHNLRIKVSLPAQLELAGSRLDPSRGFHWGYPSTDIGYFGAEELAAGVSFGNVRIYLDKFPSMEFRARATSTPVGPMMIELRSDNFPPQDVKITF